MLATRPPTRLPSATPPASTPVTTAPTPDPYAALSVAALAERAYGGGLLRIEERLEQNDDFARYLIRYPSDGLSLFGFMNVPHEGERFPVAIVLHGFIEPADYDVVDYTTRYADALARAGYMVFHPNYRNYPPSDAGDNPFRVGYAVDVLNLIAIIRAQSEDPTGVLRRADGNYIHLLGHSMGGGIALRVAIVWPEAIRALALYAAMSGDEAQNFARIQEWAGGRAGAFEREAPLTALRAISPIYHLEQLQAPVGIHHGTADTVVPPAWSDDLCARLQARAHPVECFRYERQPHTFRGAADALLQDRVIDFFRRH